MRVVVGLLLFAAVATAFLSDEDHHRAAVKIITHHSLHPPHLRDSWAGGIPYWNFGGSSVVTDDYVRLTPDRQSQVGGLWNTEVLDLPSWEMILGLHVHSKSGYGADGLALWIVDEIPTADGPLVGHPMKFKGVGLIFDSYDNDRYRDNPSVHLLYNDGSDPSRVYDTQMDFRGQAASTCYFDYRNTVKPYLATLRLRYDGATLQVFASKTSGGDEFLCATANDVKLPSSTYYVGFTAETGGISDNHDVHYLHTYPLEGATYDHDVYVHQPFSHFDEQENKHYWRAKTPAELEAEKAEKDEKDRQEKAKRDERAKKIMDERRAGEERDRVKKLEQELEQMKQQAAAQAAEHELLKAQRAAAPPPVVETPPSVEPTPPASPPPVHQPAAPSSEPSLPDVPAETEDETDELEDSGDLAYEGPSESSSQDPPQSSDSAAPPAPAVAEPVPAAEPVVPKPAKKPNVRKAPKKKIPPPA